jgi:Fe-S cluster assembly iron-binding protein IscA
MTTLKYTSSIHGSDPVSIKDRVSYYLDNDNFEVLEDALIEFPQELTKDQIIKTDAAMASLGYVRI